MPDERAGAPPIRLDDAHMPPTEIACKCGERMEGADCLDRMRVHVIEGNKADG